MKSTDLERYQDREKALRDVGWQVKAAREQGLEQGLEQGREEGLTIGSLAGKIQILEEILGLTVTSKGILGGKAIEDLEIELQNLQSQMRNRSNQSQHDVI